jgi:hypothetical protein
MTADLPPPTPLVTPPPPRRSRTNVLVAVGGGVLLTGAIVVAVVLATRGETPATTPPPAPESAPAEKPVTLIEPPPLWDPTPVAERWLDDLSRLHPADSVGLLGVSVARLRESKLVTAILEEEKEGATGKYLAMLDAACGFPVLGSIDGVLFGAANDKEVELDASFRGTFTRAQVEKCLTGILAEGDDDQAPVSRRGPVSRIQSGARTLWMVWPDRHTVFITTRAGVDEAWMVERSRGAKSVRDNPEVFSLLDEVDTGAGIWLVASPTEAGASPIPGTKPPGAIYASLLVTSELKVHAGLRFDKPEDAREMARALATQLEAFKREPLAAMWLKDAGFGVRDSDAIFTATMDHTMALITLRGLVEQLSK